MVIREQTLDARGDDAQVGEGDRAFDIVVGLNQQGLALAMSNNGRLRRPRNRVAHAILTAQHDGILGEHDALLPRGREQGTANRPRKHDDRERGRSP